jgi:hypothetical protein
MAFTAAALLFLYSFASYASAAPSVVPLPRTAAPTVTLDKGVFTGTTSSTGQSLQWLGIPFAQPP